MKVDVIQTRFGDIEVEFSTFTKGFYIKKYPDKMETITGLKLLKNRDNSFSEYKKLEEYVKKLVNDATLDFNFSRKVIIYSIKTETSHIYDSLDFKYLVCNESTKTHESFGGKLVCEYSVLESNIERYVGQRNILGQILYSEDCSIIDYDELTHAFFKNFTEKFHILKEQLAVFFKREDIVLNILNSKSELKLLT